MVDIIDVFGFGRYYVYRFIWGLEGGHPENLVWFGLVWFGLVNAMFRFGGYNV